MINFYKLITYLFLVFFFNISNAHAYLDPGTGSIILQAILAFLAAATASFLYYWTKVKIFFSKYFKKKEKSKDENTSD